MMIQPKDQGLYESRREHDACGIGAVANISGERTHAIMQHGREILVNLHHRGAAGADDVTGDGAGILFQVPHEFFAAECSSLGFKIPAPSKYGVGMIFNSKCEKLRKLNELVLEGAASYHGLKVLGWRDVPIANDCLGEIALESEPHIRQVFIDGAGLEGEQLERKLFLVRKRAEKVSQENNSTPANNFYVSSLSSRTICYKGMFMAWQLFEYYPDLQNQDVKSALAIVHQRYSTNTFPSWELAQPLRCVAHNGEINTLSGNRTWMTARTPQMESEAFGRHISDLFPILDPHASDSACFDNTLELLVRSGRSMPHSMMMLVPEAFGPKFHISTDKRAFYEYHASFMEPWDGPAAMVFTDGVRLGGTLDRNGLRPCRYLVTTDGLAVIASEAGVVNFPPEKIRQKGRLRPGHMFLIDTNQGRIVSDGEIKNKIARASHYRNWLENNRIELRGFFDTPTLQTSDPESIVRRMRVFGYTREELRMILTPMGKHGQEPVGSMGNDAPLAVLSDKPKLLYDYFKQLFAQVTNPPIDPLREGLVMSLMMYVGKKPNLLTETPQHCRQLKLPNPILTNEDIDRLMRVKADDFKVATIPCVFEIDRHDPPGSLRRGLRQLTDTAETAAKDGATLLILSDRGTDKTHAAIPSLLSTAAVHNSLLKCGRRHDVGLIVESGEPREVMHFCLLCGFGASAINPYMAFDALSELHKQGAMGDTITPDQVAENYIAAIKKGILKTMSKMGISTLRSYYGAQLFEAIGLNSDFVDEYFTGISSRIGGIGLDAVTTETITRHDKAYRESGNFLDLDFGGNYQYRNNGEKHTWNPTTVSALQRAVVSDDAEAFQQYVTAANDSSANLCTLRGLFEFVPGQSAPLDEVEPAAEIVKRFCTGAMSQGSISKEAHECMAV
ncbi:MAG: glutamate synthase subunit alpha, partial [Phycisphaerae bacterium]|nr:glutamate synthase subunit alpha [Phycisphaerae bacterium]